MESSKDRHETASSQLSVGEKIGYGLGDTASNLYWKLFEFFQLYFYTDVFGISAASAGTMFFVTKVFDAVNDPVIGLLADRTRTAWGRFRPYLLWMSIPFALTGIATFYTPNLPPTQKLIYAYVTYTLVFVAYTAINIPYGALMGVISSNPIERTTVSTYRFVLAFLGGLAVQLLTLPLVGYFGGREERLVDGEMISVVVDPQTGFFWVVVCYAIAAMFLFFVCFWTTRERVQPPADQSTSLGVDFRDLLSNGPWAVIFVFSMLQVVAGWTRGSATAYYFKYYVGDELAIGPFLSAAVIASIVGMLTARPLTQAVGARTAMAVLTFLWSIFTASFWFLRPDQIGLMYTFQILGAFFGGPIPVLMFAMFADIADYSEWKNNRRATGLIFAAATFSQKLGGAVGGAVPGWLLASFGFVAPIDGIRQVQSSETINGIVGMMSLIPAGVLLASAVVILFYRLDKAFLEKVQLELQQRKQATEPSVAAT